MRKIVALALLLNLFFLPFFMTGESGEKSKTSPEKAEEKKSITFLAMGDPQYGGGSKDKNTFQITAMNLLKDILWPEKFESTGKKVGDPEGVLIAGDLTQNGRDGRGIRAGEDELGKFKKDYGLTGEDGVLKYPVYEGYGNHDFDPDEKPDGFGTWRWFYGKNPTPVVKAVEERNAGRPGLLKTSEEGGHYSWDWGNVHFVNVNLFPGDEKSHDEQLARDPKKSLTFLKEDLKENVGETGGPVIIMQHYGFDKFGFQERWWTEEDRKAFLETIKDYNVIAILHGHSHNTSHYKWEGYDVYNLGTPYYKQYNSDKKGHFTLFRITDSSMQVADIAWTPSKKGADPHFTGWSHSKKIKAGNLKGKIKE